MACASPPEELVLPKAAVVAPVNFDAQTPSQLELGLDGALRLTMMYLQRKDVEVEALDLDELRAAYLEELGNKKRPAIDSPQYGQLMSAVLARVAPDRESVMLVIPHLLYRPAQLIGSKAAWDGTKRNVIIEGMEGFSGQFRDDTTGVSLRLRVFSDDGRLLHEGYGGIELPWKLFGVWRNNTFFYDMTDRTGEEVFANPKLVARAVTLAFDPFIPRRP